MTVVDDTKKLVKNDPKDKQLLRTYTMYSLLVCLVAAVLMAVWFFIRYNQSAPGKNTAPSPIWSIVHLVVYIGLFFTILAALYGFFFEKSQVLYWYLFVVLGVIIAEVVCILYNTFAVSDENYKYSIWVKLGKLVAIIVFGLTALLVLCWRWRMAAVVDTQPELAEKAQKPAVGAKPAEPDTKGTKAGEALIKADRKPNKK